MIFGILLGMNDIDKRLLEKIKVRKVGTWGKYELWVNGYLLGEYLGGKYQIYTVPLIWAKKQIPKRVKVINRNIQRLEKELNKWKQELIDITYF